MLLSLILYFYLVLLYLQICFINTEIFFYILFMLLLKNLLKINLDVPSPWGIYFQDSATPQMEGLVELHDKINIIVYKNQTPGKS